MRVSLAFCQQSANSFSNTKCPLLPSTMQTENLLCNCRFISLVCVYSASRTCPASLTLHHHFDDTPRQVHQRGAFSTPLPACVQRHSSTALGALFGPLDPQGRIRKADSHCLPIRISSSKSFHRHSTASLAMMPHFINVSNHENTIN